MTEVELNALFNISPERVKNVYATDSTKKADEIRRIARIFNISKEQRKSSRELCVRSLAAFKSILVSNN